MVESPFEEVRRKKIKYEQRGDNRKNKHGFKGGTASLGD